MRMVNDKSQAHVPTKCFLCCKSEHDSTPRAHCQLQYICDDHCEIGRNCSSKQVSKASLNMEQFYCARMQYSYSNLQL